jgi:membrane-bound ClpP family serine protease
MSKRQWLTVFGAWVMVFLFLGFPSSWHKIILIVSGLIIIAIAYNIPQEIKADEVGKDSSFVESNHKEIV